LYPWLVTPYFNSGLFISSAGLEQIGFVYVAYAPFGKNRSAEEAVQFHRTIASAPEETPESIKWSSTLCVSRTAYLKDKGNSIITTGSRQIKLLPSPEIRRGKRRSSWPTA